MVTELKLNDFDGDFQKEMNLLASEDAQHSEPGLDDDPSLRREAGVRYRKTEPGAEADGHHLVDSGDAIDMHAVLAKQMGMEFVYLDDYPPTDFKVLRMLSSEHARQYKVFPLEFDPESATLTLAISDPSDPTVVDDLRLTIGCNIDPVVAPEADVMDRINQYYGVGPESLDSLLEEYREEGEEDVLASEAGNIVDLSDIDEVMAAPVAMKLTNLILMKAIQENASDLHIEPFDNLLRVRYRVDGVLREMESPPYEMRTALISRLKVMADLDIAENRRPQDGRILLNLPDNHRVELRVTTAPTVHGESVVMRVLDKSMMQMGIAQLGMRQDELQAFMKQARKPNGILLVTGPTGCGKTTTLYGVINDIKSPEIKLITTEDPVEYQVDGITQININDSVGLTYSRCLRAILRQDPDRILVGEVRDLDTARISVEAALTGHMVYSTLHTNSAAGTVTRLIDMGVEPFLITSTLEAVVGQRLVRTICPSCKIEHVPIQEELDEFGIPFEEIADITFFRGEGCEECHFSGYRGRIGLFELLEMTQEIADLILGLATTDDITELALKQGMVSLRQDGWLKVCLGMTTFSEVAAHTPKEQVILDRGPESEENT